MLLSLSQCMLVVAVIVVVVAATAVATCLALPRTIGKVAGVDFLTANPARALQHNLCGHVQLFMSCCHHHPHPLGHASSLSPAPWQALQNHLMQLFSNIFAQSAS